MSHKPYKVVSLLLVAKLKNCRKSAALYIYPQMQDPKHKKVICSETVVKQLMKSIKHCYMKSCFFSKFINVYGSAMFVFPQKICQIKLTQARYFSWTEAFLWDFCCSWVELFTLRLKTLTSLTVVKSFKVYLSCSIKIQISVLSKNPNLDLNFSPLKYHLYHHDTFPGIFRM